MPRLKNIIKNFGSFFLRNRIIFSIFIVLVLVGLITSYFIFNKSSFTTMQVTRGDVSEVVKESGTVVVNGIIEIYSPTNGAIEEILVSNDQEVKEGDILFKVKSTATEQESQAAYANYLTAKSAVESAYATSYSLQADMFGKWDTFKELAESDDYETSDGAPKYEQRALPEFHIPEKVWLAAEANYKNQQNVVAQAQAQLNSAWLLYQATKNAVVKSPIAGTVTNLSVVPGSNVTIHTPVAPAPPVLRVSNFSTMEVVMLVGEDDINKIKINQKAIIKVDAIDDVVYEGLVVRVDKIGTEMKGVIRYKTYISILNPDDNLKSGMSADADIVTRQLTDVLVVPNSAIKPYQGGRAVRIPGKKKDEIKYAFVQIGIRGEKNTQIIKGLNEGQLIITSLPSEEQKKSGPFGF